MSMPVLVRGETSIWLTVGRIAGPVIAVVGIALGSFGLGWGWWLFAACGVLLSAGLEVYAAIEHRQRTWVTERDDGLDVTDRKGTRTYRDEQISAIALESERKLSNGEISGHKRTFSIWMEGETEPIVMENTIKLNQNDPLYDLINRLIGSFAARMDAIVGQGGAVAGEGWRLDRNSFIYGPPAQHEQVPLAAITAVEPFERSMCLWQQGRDDAFCRVPLKSRNAHLLPMLIGPRMKSPEERPAESSTTGLGRILFEKKPSAAWPPLCVVAGIVAIIVGICLVAGNIIQQPQEPTLLFVGIGLVPVGIGCLVGAVALKYMSFRCHERGVYKASLFGDKMLPYKDVATFTYSAVRHYHNGAYVGTHLSMKFDPVAGSGSSAISYSTTVQAVDDDLDELRDTISGILAENMIQQLATNQTVPWTTNLTFQREGIQYRPAGWISRGEPQFMKYDDYGGYNIDQGVFYLYFKGQQKPITNEQTSAANFFPGFFMLLRMLHVKE
jgi:hypothetical protein